MESGKLYNSGEALGIYSNSGLRGTCTTPDELQIGEIERADYIPRVKIPQGLSSLKYNNTYS